MLVCITGKCGSGKSTAIQYIKKQGYNTWEADAFIHETYLKGNLGYEAIHKAFGDDYVTDKEVNRKALGKLVFNDKKALKKLNSITLPIIRNKLLELKNKDELIFAELAIYINHEKYFSNLFDKVVLISASKSLEKNNLEKKFNGLRKFPTKSVGNIKNPISSVKIKRDFFVDNSKNKKNLYAQLKKILTFF